MEDENSELEEWAELARNLASEDYRKKFFALLKQSIDEDNNLIAREGLQNPTVNHLQIMRNKVE